jgi:hypothetical protein
MELLRRVNGVHGPFRACPQRNIEVCKSTRMLLKTSCSALAVSVLVEQCENLRKALYLPAAHGDRPWWPVWVATRQPAHGTARAPDDGRQLEKCNRGNQRTAVYRLRITRSPPPGPLVGKWLLRHRNRVKFRILVHQNRIGL